MLEDCFPGITAVNASEWPDSGLLIESGEDFPEAATRPVALLGRARRLYVAVLFC